jgi:hypothetical protein
MNANEMTDSVPATADQASARVPSQPRTHLAFLLFGLVALLAGAALIAVPRFEPTVPLPNINPYSCFMLSALFLGMAAVVHSVQKQRVATLAVEANTAQAMYMIQHLQDEMAGAFQQIMTPAQCEEIVERHFANAGTGSENQSAHVAQSINRVSELATSIQQKLEEHERARLTIAGTLDGIAARIERLQKEMKSQPAPRIDLAEDLAPLARSFDNLVRDHNSRITQFEDTMRAMHDELAAMEGRLRQRVDDVMAQLELSMEQQQAAPRYTPAPAPQAPAHTAMSPIVVPDAALPAPVAEGVQITEGPRESKTVLKAIDKLRALRGN